MAIRKVRIRNAEVTPPVRTDVFRASPHSRFAIIALGRGLRANAHYSAYLDLRTGVYTVQTGMLDLDELTYGVDIDDDDERAVAWVVLENRDPDPVAVACIRVIERLWVNDRPLPADALYGLDLDATGVEVSRYIARVNDSTHQAQALSELLRSTIAHIRRLGADDAVYAIVEPALERVLRMMGVGVLRVAESVWVKEYHGDNVAIKLDPVVSAERLGGIAEIDAIDVGEGAIRFWGEVER